MSLIGLLCGLAVGGVVLPLPLFLYVWVEMVVRPLCWPLLLDPETRRQGFDPAPEWMPAALQALPRKQLNATELELMNKDGVVAARDVLNNERVLAELRRIFTHKHNPTHHWNINGVMNAVVHHSPLAALASSALGGKAVTICNAQVEPRPASSERGAPYPERPWEDHIPAGHLLSASMHNDVGAWPGALHTGGHFVIPMASAFIALTNIPHGLEFLAGSHVANRRHRCPHGPEGLNWTCMESLEHECYGYRSWDLKPGDVVLFWGETYHWTRLTEKPRQALSIRFLPADLIHTGRQIDEPLADQYPPICKPLGGSVAHPILHPPPAGAYAKAPRLVWPACPRVSDLGRWKRWMQIWWARSQLPPPECGHIEM